MEMSGFTEEQLSVREAVQKICTQFPNEYWQQHDQMETDPKELHAALAADGWLGIALPEEFGGAGLGISEATMMLQTISQSGAGMAGAQSIHANVYATQPLARFGNKEQLESTIPNIISGKWRVCFGVTEPNTGLDTLKLKTSATRKGDKYVISGKHLHILFTRSLGPDVLTRCRPEDMDNMRSSRFQNDSSCPDHPFGRSQEAERRPVNVLHRHRSIKSCTRTQEDQENGRKSSRCERGFL